MLQKTTNDENANQKPKRALNEEREREQEKKANYAVGFLLRLSFVRW